MRKYKHRRKRKQRKIIIGSVFTLLICISIGYAAFQTTLKVNVKGSVFDKGDACFEIEDNGDGTATITDYDKTCGSEVVIPSKIKGKTITKIASSPTWQAGKTKSFCKKELTKVTIPDTVTDIGKWAFHSNSISELNLGSGIQTIGVEAFHSNKITTLSFPNSLKSIGNGAFMANLLTSIPPLNNITYGGGAFTYNNLPTENAIIYGKDSNGNIDKTILNSYAARDKVDTLNIPDGVKTLSIFALRYSNADVINLPNSIEKIEASAFQQSKVSTLSIPSSINSISSLAFNGASNLKTITINRKENAISGSPWCTSSCSTNLTVNWTGSN